MNSGYIKIHWRYSQEDLWGQGSIPKEIRGVASIPKDKWWKYFACKVWTTHFPPPTPLSLMWQMYTHKFSAPVTVLSLCLSTRIPSFWEYQDTESRLFRVFEKTWHLVWERSQEYQIHCYWSESLLMHKQQMFNYGNFQSQVQRAENLQGPNTPKCSCNLLALCGIGTWNIGKDSLPCKDWLKKQAWKSIFIVFSTIGRCVHTRKYS